MTDGADPSGGRPIQKPPGRSSASALRSLDRRSLAVGAAVGGLAVGIVWAATGLGLGSSSFDMTGSMTLTSKATTYPPPGCHGYSGFDDIDQGGAVTVYDAQGAVVASGALGQGASTNLGGCVFPITVTGVPSGPDFYQVEVTHRGKVTVQAADAKTGRVALSIGG